MTPASAPGRAVNAAEFAGLRPAQLAWLAGAVVIVSAGHGALLPVLPAWLASMMPGVDPAEVSRHVGFLGGAYAAGILLGAPLWGVVSDRVGRGRILILGLVGYVASLLLLQLPAMAGLWGIYALRGTTGFFVAAVVPVVSLLVAQHTPEQQRARRFARLGAMSLLGFLFGPAPSVVANEVGPWFGSWFGDGAAWPVLSARVVLVLSALLGGAVMFVLAGFELGIVLQGQQQSGQSSRQAAIMLAECSLVMPGVNALLFITSLLERVPARVLMGAGLLFATVGSAVLAADRSDAWMYLGVSQTSAGTGLVLPVIAYLAAGAAPQRLGVVMGGLAAAAGLGQTLGSAAGGWLFGTLAHRSFGWRTVPLFAMLGLLLARPRWWSVLAEASTIHPQRLADRVGSKVTS